MVAPSNIPSPHCTECHLFCSDVSLRAACRRTEKLGPFVPACPGLSRLGPARPPVRLGSAQCAELAWRAGRPSVGRLTSIQPPRPTGSGDDGAAAAAILRSPAGPAAGRSAGVRARGYVPAEDAWSYTGFMLAPVWLQTDSRLAPGWLRPAGRDACRACRRNLTDSRE